MLHCCKVLHRRFPRPAVMQHHEGLGLVDMHELVVSFSVFALVFIPRVKGYGQPCGYCFGGDVLEELRRQ